eukprot:TRINITY_DN11299_c0_g1_i1.p1 TRINITY_DN11299_c0_g1~~TRINITY_DN11299_c0_g1_i1.p1  ORF type:complete len:321 (-),score=85.41 TRINITY_DN11299_c0_g1_i1:153-1091(-)
MNSKIFGFSQAFAGRSAFPAARFKAGINPRVFMARNPVRFYARMSSRRTTVTEEQRRTDTQTGLQTPQESWWKPGQQQQQEQQQTYQHYEHKEDYGDETTEQAITPEVSAFLTKVYGTLMAGTATAAVGAAAGTMMPGLAGFAMIGSFAGIIGLMFAQKPAVRTTLFIAITSLLGLSIGPTVAASSAGALMAASLGTAGIFGGFTLMALKAKRQAMLTMGGPLLGGLFCLILCSLGGWVLPMLGVTNPALLAALYNVNLYGGLAIFSLFISYDTQRMIESFKEGQRDHIAPALNMFLNLFNIFIRLLQIFRD